MENMINKKYNLYYLYNITAYFIYMAVIFLIDSFKAEKIGENSIMQMIFKHIKSCSIQSDNSLFLFYKIKYIEMFLFNVSLFLFIVFLFNVFSNKNYYYSILKYYPIIILSFIFENIINNNDIYNNQLFTLNFFSLGFLGKFNLTVPLVIIGFSLYYYIKEKNIIKTIFIFIFLNIFMIIYNNKELFFNNNTLFNLNLYFYYFYPLAIMFYILYLLTENKNKITFLLLFLYMFCMYIFSYFFPYLDIAVILYNYIFISLILLIYLIIKKNKEDKIILSIILFSIILTPIKTHDFIVSFLIIYLLYSIKKSIIIKSKI